MNMKIKIEGVWFDIKENAIGACIETINKSPLINGHHKVKARLGKGPAFNRMITFTATWNLKDKIQTNFRFIDPESNTSRIKWEKKSCLNAEKAMMEDFVRSGLCGHVVGFTIK